MKFLVETEGDFDEYSILDALSDIFPKDEFKVTEVEDLTFENWKKDGTVAKNATTTKKIELVEE